MSEKLTDDRLREIKERAENIKRLYPPGTFGHVHVKDMVNTDIPDLLAHAAALQAEIDRLNCKGVMPKWDGLRVIPNKFLPRGVIMANPDDLGLTEIEPTIGEEEI